jgi:hypothetical protein
VIGPGLPVLDYLGGEVLSASGGRPRHLVEVESGYYNNGLGARLSADWRSGTRLASSGDDLRFSPYATFDLRLFANLGERLDLVTRVPFLRGSSVRFEVNNIFNARPEVSGGAGIVPFAYQPDRLEPIGRTVGITFRKLFVPNRFVRPRMCGDEPCSRSEAFALGALEAVDDDLLGILGIAPVTDAGPLLGLEVLIMGEEVGDLVEHDLGQMLALGDVFVVRRGL